MSIGLHSVQVWLPVCQVFPQTQTRTFLSVCSSSHCLGTCESSIDNGCCVSVCVCVRVSVSIFVLFKILLTWLFDQHTVTVSQPYFTLYRAHVFTFLYQCPATKKKHLDETVDTDLRFYKYLAGKRREGENVCIKQIWHLLSDKSRRCALLRIQACLKGNVNAMFAAIKWKKC